MLQVLFIVQSSLLISLIAMVLSKLVEQLAGLLNNANIPRILRGTGSSTKTPIMKQTSYQLWDVPDIERNLDETPVAPNADIFAAIMIWIPQAD